MEIYRIPFFDNFECLKGECPVTCCHGWQIPIDPATIEKYNQTNLKLRLKLRLARGVTKDLPVFNSRARDCAFFTNDGLCGLQLEHGEDLLPGICRRFPRRLKNYGPLCEEALELACPAAASLFLSARKLPNRSGILYHKLTDQVSYPDTSTNDDALYLTNLIKLRESIIEELISSKIDTGTELFNKLTRLNDYGKRLQTHCAITGIDNPTPDLSIIERNDSEFKVPNLSYYFDAKTLDELMCSGIYHKNLKTRLPLFFEICSTYFETFDSLTVAQANAKITEAFDTFTQKYEDAVPILLDYYIYYLQTNFLFTYEDYSFFKMFALGAMHVELLLLFFVLYEEKNASFTKEECAIIISNYDRHMRHNDEVIKNMYEILR